MTVGISLMENRKQNKIALQSLQLEASSLQLPSLPHHRHRSLLRKDLSGAAFHLCLINICAAGSGLSFLLSIPSGGAVVDRKIGMLEHEIAPAIINTQVPDDLDTTAGNIEDIVLSVVVRSKSVWNVYMIRRTDHFQQNGIGSRAAPLIAHLYNISCFHKRRGNRR